MKVVYNACFGGFSLSRKAILLARQISGDSNWGGPCIIGDHYSNGELVKGDYAFVTDIPRHDPVLISVIEQLGREAEGYLSVLEIKELPDGSRYRIDEYDGSESVETPDSYEWVIP